MTARRRTAAPWLRGFRSAKSPVANNPTSDRMERSAANATDAPWLSRSRKAANKASRSESPEVPRAAAASAQKAPAQPHGSRNAGDGKGGPSSKLGRATAQPDTLGQRPAPKVNARHDPESRQRKSAARVSIGVFVAAVAAGLASWVTRSIVAPMPFGSWTWIERLGWFWSDAWMIGLAVDGLLAFLAACAFLACTLAHAPIPSTARGRAQLIMACRQTPAVAIPNGLKAAMCASGAWALYHAGFILLSIPLQVITAAFALIALAQTFIPTCRAWMVVERTPQHQGLGNRVATGGGLQGIFSGMVVILHHELVDVQLTTNPVEFACGLAGLSFRRRSGSPLRIGYLGDRSLVQFLCYDILADGRVGRSIEGNAMGYPDLEKPLNSASAAQAV